MQQKLKSLSVLSLVMMTIVSVDSIRNLPATALFGSSLIFFFTLATVFFLIPTALVAAELASSWEKNGGIYLWVKQAFGEKAGFLAIWFQWIENIIWYPTILSFIGATIGYLIAPSLANDKYFLMAVIICSFWGATIINWMGIKSSAGFSTFCSITGLIIPMILIIALGISWIMLGKPLAINLTPHALIPNLNNPEMWVALTGIMLSFCGMEIAAVHAGDVNSPKKSFPRALLIATIFIFISLLLGALAIAIVIPTKQISLVAGIMEAFTLFFTAYHMQWILPIVAILLVIGGLGGLSNWIIAPARGLLVAAKDGLLPQQLQKTNKHGAPILLLYQAIITTLLSTVFLLIPSVNGSYWLLTALASQLYMFMYLFMFSAAIYLRYTNPNLARNFKIPGGNFGIWLVAGAGLIGSVVTIFIGFLPPDGVKIGSLVHYEFLLITGLILMIIPPFISFKFKKSSWALNSQ